MSEKEGKRRRFEPLERRVLRTIRRHQMIRRGERVLLAVSGGADSMALLRCMQSLAPHIDWELTVAHFNHGVRGAEADRDEEFVRATCSALNIPFISGRGGTGGPASGHSANLEEAMRSARYAFLARAAQSIGAHRIATGHTLDDQAETVLLRLLRGSGLEGWSAIHPAVDGFVVRPMLDCTRREVSDYLCATSIPHREDASNRDLRYRRNRIRHELIPYLKANFNPRLVETLAREASLAREILDYLEVRSRRAYESMRTESSGCTALPASELRELPSILRNMAIRRAIRECRGSLRRITARHVDGIAFLCRAGCSGRRVELPGGGHVVREFGALVFRGAPPAAAPRFSYALQLPGYCEVPELDMAIRATVITGAGPPPAGPADLRACLAAESLPEVLSVRSRFPGDRFAGPEQKSVKEAFQEARIPISARRRLPLVVAGDEVVWAPGLIPPKSITGNPEKGRCVLLEVVRAGSAPPGDRITHRRKKE